MDLINKWTLDELVKGNEEINTWYISLHFFLSCSSNITVFSSLSFSSPPPEWKSGQHLYSFDRRGFTQLPASSPCCYFRQMLLKCLASPAWNGPESKLQDCSETAESRDKTFPGQDSISLKSNRTSLFAWDQEFILALHSRLMESSRKSVLNLPQ